MSDTITAHAGVEVRGPAVRRSGDILTTRRWPSSPSCSGGSAGRRDELLAARTRRRAEAARTGRLDFLPETAGPARGLDGRGGAGGPRDRRVEITGPPEPKMAINALNSGAQGVAGRPGGREHPALAQRHRRAADPVRRHPPARWPSTRRRARRTGWPPTGGWR